MRIWYAEKSAVKLCQTCALMSKHDLLFSKLMPLLLVFHRSDYQRAS